MSAATDAIRAASPYRTIHLHGSLGTAFEKSSYRLMVKSPAEAVRALCTMLPGFEAAVRAGYFRCIVGKTKKQGRGLAEDTLSHPWRTGEHDFHMVPAVKGAGGRGGGVGKAIAGVAIIVAAVLLAPTTAGGSIAFGATAIGTAGSALSVSYGMIAFAGLTMVLGGLSQILSPQAKTPGAAQTADASKSFLFNSIGNVSEQGGPIPLIYGQCMVGSTVIALGLNPEDIPITTDYVDPGIDDPTIRRFT